METILTMTDFSRSAENAVERAASLAARVAAPLQLVYDADRAGRERLPERLLHLTMRALQLERRWNIAVTQPARAGVVVQGLQVVDRQHAMRRDAGADGLGLATRLGRAAAPMLVVRRSGTQPYRSVLLPCVSRADAERLQAAAARWFDGASWELFQLVPCATAHEWPPPVNTVVQGAIRCSDYLSSRRNRHRFMRGAADPVEQIANQAQCSAADLVIVSVPPSGVGRRLLRRTFQERLARRLGCDLLVLPAADEAAPMPAPTVMARHPDAAQSNEAGADNLPVLLAWTDLSPEAEAMLEKAGSLAAAQGLRLRLGYCRTSEAPFDAPLARLKQRTRHLRRLFGIPVEVIGREIRGLEELQHELQQCTLTCVAQAFKPGDVDVLNKLLQLRTVPVLVFRSVGEMPYDRVLVPVSLTSHSAALVRWARLGGAQAQIELLHVCEAPAGTYGTRSSTVAPVLDRYLAQARLEALRKMRALLPAGWERRSGQALAHGDVGAQIAELQAQGGHALVIVGATRRPAWLEFLRPSLAQQLSRTLAADVLVVPQPALSWRARWRDFLGTAP